MIEFEGIAPKVVTLDEIINKPSWNSEDVEFLVANIDELPDKVLAKLGVKRSNEPTEEEIQKEIEAITKKKK